MIELLEFRYTNEADTQATLRVRIDDVGFLALDAPVTWDLPLPPEAVPASSSKLLWCTWGEIKRKEIAGKPLELAFPLALKREAELHSLAVMVRALEGSLWTDRRSEDQLGVGPEGPSGPGSEADSPPPSFHLQGVMRTLPDPVDHPAHYGGADDPYETIKVLRAWLSPEEFRGFVKGNAIKYLSRASRKGAPAEDAAKAAWYSNVLKDL